MLFEIDKKKYFNKTYVQFYITKLHTAYTIFFKFLLFNPGKYSAFSLYFKNVKGENYLFHNISLWVGHFPHNKTMFGTAKLFKLCQATFHQYVTR